MVDQIDGTPMYVWSALAVVSGWFTFLDAVEVPLWESQSVTASARIPVGIDLAMTDRLGVLSPQHPVTQGWWNVVTVRFSPAHLRAMLRRTDPK